MPRESYTAHFRERTGNTSGETPLILLEITHADLAVPVRVVNDTQDIVSGGETFVAFSFDITLPADIDKQLPRATLTLDNVGRELTQWLDASLGGRGSQCRVMQIMRDTPDVLEFDSTYDMLNVSQSITQVSCSLGYDDTLNLPGLAMFYRPENTPGLY